MRAPGDRALLFLVALFLAALSLSRPSDRSARLPGPALAEAGGRGRAIPLINAACEGCHADIAAEWRASHHHASFTDSAFQTALARENDAFCRGCHAPEAPSRSAPPPDLAALGVACTSCHLPGDVVVAAPKEKPDHAPHASARLPEFAGTGACAGCHEFDFPAKDGRASADKMQLTVTEHAASPYAEVTCAGCHMPFVGEGSRRHRSHAFASSRDAGAQASALDIKTERRGELVEVTVGPGEVGHAFPTGDLFRRLSITVEVAGDDGSLLLGKTRYLGRHFRAVRQSSGERERVAVVDDRPGAPMLLGNRLLVPFSLGPIAKGKNVVVRVDYERVLEVHDAHEERAEIESSVNVFQQILPPSPLPDTKAKG